MKRRTMQQVIPALIMTGAATVPIVTMAEILTHVPGGGTALGTQPSAPVAAAPPGLSSGNSTASAPAASGGPRTFQGPPVGDPFGTVQATVTLSRQKITDVLISAPMNNGRSAVINQQAVPYLRSETLQAQSANINTISGATYTSQAYIQSLQGALNQARSQGNTVAANPSSSAAAGQSRMPSVKSSGDD